MKFVVDGEVTVTFKRRMIIDRWEGFDPAGFKDISDALNDDETQKFGDVKSADPRTMQVLIEVLTVKKV